MNRGERDQLTVGEVAQLARISVRTLHHYDETGLLRPSERSASGYRLYDRDDLERLQQILFLREVGLGISEIRECLSSGEAQSRRATLQRQRELLQNERNRLDRMTDLIERTLATTEGGIRMTKEEMFEVFGDFDPTVYEAEAERRWKESDQYAEAARRTRNYTKEEWARYCVEAETVTHTLAELLATGANADDPTVQEAVEAVEAQRLLIDRWFYACSPEMHAALGKMYASDPRFGETYDRVRPGLASFIAAATAAAVPSSRA